MNKEKKSFVCRASITVEAAFATPLFIAAVLAFCFFFRLMQVENMLQTAITKTAENIASYGYAYSCADAVAESQTENIFSKLPFGDTVFQLLGGYADDYAIKLLTSKYVDRDVLKKGRVINGWEGVSFSGSALNDADNCTVITITYKVEIPVISGITPPFEVSQRAAAGQFSGKISLRNTETAEQDETVVYVTTNGTVYHTSRDCTYLVLTTEAVSPLEVGNLRNYKGGKYYPCEYCAVRKKKPETVYINYYGDRYHYRTDCISLRRTVIETTLDKVNLPLCSRCAEHAAAQTD